MKEKVRNINFFISMGRIFHDNAGVRFDGPDYHKGFYLESHINIFKQMIEDDLHLIHQLKKEKICSEAICREWNFEVVITDAVQEYNYWKEQWLKNSTGHVSYPYPDDIILSEDDEIALGTAEDRHVLREKIMAAARKDWGEDGENHDKFRRLKDLSDKIVKVNLKYTFAA